RSVARTPNALRPGRLLACYLMSRAVRSCFSEIGISPNSEATTLDGAEHGRGMHVPAGPISFDRNAIDCSCLPLPLVPARDWDRACAQRTLRSRSAPAPGRLGPKQGEPPGDPPRPSNAPL